MRVSVFCGGTYVSGMEIKALNLLSALAERGHEIHVLASGWNDGDFVARLEERGLSYEMVYLGKVTKSLNPKHLWWMANTVAKLPGALHQVHGHLREFDPDIVLIFNRDAALLAAPLLRRRHCVFHVGELATPTSWTRRIYRRLDSFVDSWIGNSHFVVQELKRFGIAESKVRVVYNGIPHAVVSQAERVSNGGPVRIGICGQVGRWKGHDDLLDALARLDRRGVKCRCLVFGRGDEEYVGSLRMKAAQAGLSDRIEWCGFLESPARMYREIDVLVVPSRFEEPFGNVAAEAGLNGLPAVVTRRGGLPEIIVDGETGFVVEAERPDDLADRLARLITSPDLRARMGAAARQRVQSLFTVEKMAEGHERVFQAALTGSSAQTHG